jgi:hypothetical protein
LHCCGTADNLISDAHITALALEQGYAIYSADNDFKRFPGIQHVNPLEPSGLWNSSVDFDFSTLAIFFPHEAAQKVLVKNRNCA